MDWGEVGEANTRGDWDRLDLDEVGEANTCCVWGRLDLTGVGEANTSESSSVLTRYGLSG